MRSSLTSATCGIERSRGLSGRLTLGPVTQGIGLRPQPWAEISRPVGPDGPVTHVIYGHAAEVAERFRISLRGGRSTVRTRRPRAEADRQFAGPAAVTKHVEIMVRLYVLGNVIDLPWQLA